VKIVCPTTLKAKSLDPTFITASPLERAQKRHARNIPIERDIYEEIQEEESLLTPSLGRPGISIRGSRAADRVYHIYKKAPLHLGDGSGVLQNILGEEWIDSVQLLKSPASTLIGNGGLSGSLLLDTKVNTGNHLSVNSTSLDTHRLRLQHGDRDFQANFFVEKSHESYNHKEGVGYTASRLRQNHRQTYRPSLILQKNWQDIQFDGLFVFAKSHGDSPPINNSDKIDFQQESFFASLSAEKNYDWFLQSYYLSNDNHNKEPNFHSSIQNQRSGFIAEKTLQLRPSLISEVGTRYDHLNADNVYESTPLKKLRTEWDTYANLSYLWKDYLIEPQLRYLWEYDKDIKALHITKANKENTFWLSYAEGYRSPSIYDLYFNGPNSTANPELQPENSYQIEFGWKDGHYTAKAFFIEYQDLFLTKQISSKWKTLNLSAAKVQGIELDAIFSGDLYEQFHSVSLQNADGKSISHLDLSPTLKFLSRFSYFWGPVKWSIYFRSWYDYYINQTKAPSWLTTNLMLESYAIKSFRITMKYENIFRRQITYTPNYPEALNVLSLDFSYSF